MSEEMKRKPVAFDLPREDAAPKPRSAPRAPIAVSARQMPVVIEETEDVFNELATLPDSEPEVKSKRRWTLGGVFLAAFSALVSLATALWTGELMTRLFNQADWLGWTGLAATAVAGAALLLIGAREWIALRRLNRVTEIRAEAQAAYEDNDAIGARAVMAKLDIQLKSQPETAQGRRTLDETKGEIVDGRDLIALAETEILEPLDRRAQSLIANAAKRVSVVTAVSPRALVDIGYILFESFKLIRQLSELYGNRPATLGLLRLARNVIAHLAVTGSIAAGDSIIQQLLGHGLAAKLSARLGEGVINGLMTARVGIAAMDIVRPLPFKARKRPGISDFIGELTRIGGSATPK
jgi:putative membrane protein